MRYQYRLGFTSKKEPIEVTSARFEFGSMCDACEASLTRRGVYSPCFMLENVHFAFIFGRAQFPQLLSTINKLLELEFYCPKCTAI